MFQKALLILSILILSETCVLPLTQHFDMEIAYVSGAGNEHNEETEKKYIYNLPLSDSIFLANNSLPDFLNNTPILYHFTFFDSIDIPPEFS